MRRDDSLKSDSLADFMKFGLDNPKQLQSLKHWNATVKRFNFDEEGEIVDD